MKVGDLVKVKMKYKQSRTGIIVKVQRVGARVATLVVQPIDPGLQIYAGQDDVEVINESR